MAGNPFPAGSQYAAAFDRLSSADKRALLERMSQSQGGGQEGNPLVDAVTGKVKNQAIKYGLEELDDLITGGSTAASGGSLGGGLMTGADGALYNAAGEMVGVGSAVNGGTMMADGTVLGGQTALTKGPIATALPYLGAAAGAYGLYNLGDNWGRGDRSLKGAGMSAGQGAMSGAAVGSVIPGVGTLAGAIIGGLFGGASSMVKAGKHKDQKLRDAVRKKLQEVGVIDDKYNLTLADGGKYDIGKDGKPDARWGGMRPYELVHGEGAPEGQGDVIGFVNPLAEIIGGGDDKIRSDFAGYFTKAAMSDGDAKANARKFFADAKLDKNKAIERLGQLKQDKGVTDEEYNAYVGGINVLFGGDPPSGQHNSERGTEEASGKRRKRKPKPKRDDPKMGPGWTVDPNNPTPRQPDAPGFDKEAYARALAELYARRQGQKFNFEENPWLNPNK